MSKVNSNLHNDDYINPSGEKHDNLSDVNYDEAVVKKVREDMLDSEHFEALTSFFKTLGDNTRIKIIYALSQRELCVSDLAGALDMTQSAVSHQLKLLRLVNQVKSRREGRSVYYSLDDQHIMDILHVALVHTGHKLEEKSGINGEI